jgi:hypothetical protein
MTAAEAAILPLAAAPRDLDLVRAMRWVAARDGMHPQRQPLRIARLVLPPHRMLPKKCHSSDLFRRRLPAGTARGYVSDRTTGVFNLLLQPLLGERHHALLKDRLPVGLLRDRAGPRTTPIRAAHAAARRVRALEHLSDAAAIAAFRSDPANLPVFGKPVHGTLGIGGVLVREAGPGGRLTLGDGRDVAAAELAAEIVRHFGHGYLFQPVLRQHAQAEALTGPAVGMLRVCTIRTAAGPEVLYVVQRPPPGSISDGAVQRRPNAQALVDPATRRILRAQDLAQMASFALDRSLATGAPLVGHVLPFVAEACAQAVSRQALIRGHGILGMDVALNVDGPAVNEIYGNPDHMLCQRAADRGLCHRDLAPPLAAAEAERRVREERYARPAAKLR